MADALRGSTIESTHRYGVVLQSSYTIRLISRPCTPRSSRFTSASTSLFHCRTLPDLHWWQAKSKWNRRIQKNLTKLLREDFLSPGSMKLAKRTYFKNFQNLRTYMADAFAASTLLCTNLSWALRTNVWLIALRTALADQRLNSVRRRMTRCSKRMSYSRLYKIGQPNCLCA